MSVETEYKEVPHSHLPVGVDGSGYYSDNTIGCYNVIQAAHTLIIGALKSINIKDITDSFCIADYGTADGGTSLPLINSCVQTLREIHGDSLPIHIVYEDQPTNDFKSIFLRINGLFSGSTNFFEAHKNVYVTACGTSFYSQCLPPHSVHVGFSATAMHWLRAKPCDITQGIHHTMIKDSTEEKLFKNQAADDWQHILLNRAKELKPGGFLVLVQLAKDNDGQYLGNTKDTPNSMFHTMAAIWNDMKNEGVIDEVEFHRTTFINYYRTIEEFTQPFSAAVSPVLKAGLKLCSIETKVVRCPYHEKWTKLGGDAKQHAKQFVPTTRTWSNHTFYSALSPERSEEQRRYIVDELFKRFEHRVSESPSDYPMHYVHAYILIQKDLV